LRGAMGRFLEGAKIGEDTDDAAVQAAAWVAPPVALTYTGPLGEALTWTDRVLAACAGDPDRGAAITSYSVQARALQIRAGVLARAAAAVDEAVTVARSQGAKVVESLALMIRAQVRRTGGDGAPIDLQAALDLAQKTGALTYEPFIREELGRLHRDQSELTE